MDEQKKSHLLEWLQRQHFFPRTQIVYVAVHGSRLYGTSGTDSDTDLYVVFEDEQRLTEKGNTVNYKDETVGSIDITYFSKKEFLERIKIHDYYAMEAIFVPSEFVIIGDANEYRINIKIHPPYIRQSFGQICRNAWNRGCKKLENETTEQEHYIGKKSLYHCLRIFIYADQLYRTGKIDFYDPRCIEVNQFYSNIKNKAVSELVENGKIKKDYQDMYKKYDQKFREIPNEEQYRQQLKKK